MEYSEFKRAFLLRSSGMMWFLGAGASVSAGVPSAADMIWQFKRDIYCTEVGVPLDAIPEVGNSRTRETLDRYFGAFGWPTSGASEEYSFYFEKAYPDEGDRRRYMRKAAANAKPSRGHRALAAIAAEHNQTILWTTNFDRLIEEALAALIPQGDFDVASPDTSHVPRLAVSEGRKCVVVKLHGDFSSRHLKNTERELAVQDSVLRNDLAQIAASRGLVVVGYSGRDASVMEALKAAMEVPGAFPLGLFWVHRQDWSPPDSVVDLFKTAAAIGVEAHLVPCETFDELAVDLATAGGWFTEDVAPVPLAEVALPSPGNGWPVLRFNALELLQLPEEARLIDAPDLTSSDIQLRVQKMAGRIHAIRRREGIIAFGSDVELERALGVSASGFGWISIRRPELRRESSTAGLVLECLAHSLARAAGIEAVRRGRGWRLVVSENASSPTVSMIRGAVGDGKVSGTLDDGTVWREAADISINTAGGRFWLTFESTIDLSNPQAPNVPADLAREFARERQSRRYNLQANRMLGAWTDVFRAAASKQLTEPDLPPGAGASATFSLGLHTAYARGR